MIWVVLLAGAAALFALLWGLQRRSLQQAARSLREIGSGEAGRRLRLETPGKTMEELVWEVNRILDEKQQAQIAYRRSEKERRDEIANISHDLRTPLTSILGYLQLAQTEDCTEEERKEYLRIAENRAHSLQTLLAGFYNLSRLGADGYPLKPEAVRAGEVLCQLAADYYGDFTAAGMEPSLQLPGDLPPVWADRNGMTRVFGNLMQNAIKHGSHTLFIRGRQVGDAVEILFSNEAPGLKEEDVRQLFDRFFTADRMRTGQNTGLGLAIVKALCEKMGGQVEASLSDGVLTFTTRWKVYPGKNRQ